jgi:hypothetical protein
VTHDKDLLGRVQLLQNRVQQVERRLTQRDVRDRWLYPCIVGYFLLQAILSIRRSMLN